MQESFKLAIICAEEGDFMQLTQIVKANPNTATNKTDTGTTLLHHAVKYRRYEIASFLIKMGAHINARIKSGQTALFMSSINNDPKMCYLLLQCNAEINAPDNNGWTPMHAACFKGHVDIVKLLLLYFPDLQLRDKSGKTCFDRAKNGSIEYLLAHQPILSKPENDSINEIIRILHKCNPAVSKSIHTAVGKKIYEYMKSKADDLHIKKDINSLVLNINGIINCIFQMYSIPSDKANLLNEEDVTKIYNLIGINPLASILTTPEKKTDGEFVNVMRWETNKEIAMLQAAMKEECIYISQQYSEEALISIKEVIDKEMDDDLNELANEIFKRTNQRWNECLLRAESNIKRSTKARVREQVSNALILQETGLLNEETANMQQRSIDLDMVCKSNVDRRRMHSMDENAN